MLSGCNDPHEGPLEVATAFQKAIESEDYSGAVKLLSDTCMTLSVESDLKEFFQTTPSVLSNPSTGKLLPAIGDWPRFRLIEFTSNDTQACSVSDHVTVFRNGDTWEVVWVDHLAKNSVIDENIDPFNTLTQVYCAAQNFGIEYRRDRIQYAGVNLDEIIPKDRWVQEVALTNGVFFYDDHTSRKELEYRWKSSDKHSIAFIQNYNFQIWSAFKDLREDIPMTRSLLSAIGNFHRKNFNMCADIVVNQLSCQGTTPKGFDRQQIDYILSTITEYQLNLAGNQKLRKSYLKYWDPKGDSWFINGGDWSSAKEFWDNLRAHVPSQENVNRALETASLIESEELRMSLISRINDVVEKLESSKQSHFDPDLLPTKLASDEHRELCFNAFHFFSDNLPEEALEAFCACSFFGNSNLDVLLVNTAEFLKDNEDCVQRHILKSLNLSDSQIGEFWEGVEAGGRATSRDEFAQACAKGVDSVPSSEAIALCGCLYDKAKGQGIQLEALAGEFGQKLGRSCAKELGIEL